MAMYWSHDGTGCREGTKVRGMERKRLWRSGDGLSNPLGLTVFGDQTDA